MSKKSPRLPSESPLTGIGQPGDGTDSPEYRQFLNLLADILYESLIRQDEEARLRERGMWLTLWKE